MSAFIRLSGSLLRLVFALAGATRAFADPPTITLRTFDEVELTAAFRPAEGKGPFATVILLHDLGADHTAWSSLFQPINAAGWNALAIDLRGHGPGASENLRESVAKQDPQTLTDMFQDVRAAYDWLAERDCVDRSRLALVGEGLGANVAIAYAAEDRSVDALFLIAPRADQPGLSTTQDMGRLASRRIEIITGPATRSAAETLARIAGGRPTSVTPKPGATSLVDGVSSLKTLIPKFLRAAGPDGGDSPVYASINSNVYHLPGAGWLDTIKPGNLRVFSSAREAEQRGLRRAKSTRPSDLRRKTKP